jgi:hypothetical protein
VYLLTHSELCAHKIGVTGEKTSRLRKHQANGWKVVRTLPVASGSTALYIERSILDWWRGKGWPPAVHGIDGYTETVSSEVVSTRTVWRHTLAAYRQILDAGI